MWGQADILYLRATNSRIIPTRVGTSDEKHNARYGIRDHPHACGDKPVRIWLYWIVIGSSPRVWGQATRLLSNRVMFGIIPTRVGTRTRAKRKTAIGGDHPHACGDKMSVNTLTVFVIGSSPRVWGQVDKKDRRRTQRKDHPHACGDKNVYYDQYGKVQGSSPRVWGQGFVAFAVSVAIRIIPTRVGTRSTFTCL